MAFRASTLRSIREWHLYLGLFFAPMLLLFSVSGAVQTYRVPDQPAAPGWIKWMASVHKDQALPHARKPKKPDEPAKAGAATGNGAKPDAVTPPKHNKLPLQIFVTLLSVGLFCSTLLGVTIAINSRATRRISLVLLVAGTIVPLVLLYL
ncbi:hypothetical protein FHS31_000594 [Sphingomonas vulcanisoli]|uniref:PepSY domain-containing protein n=1 Tax=Sphingomonas vulcanisoli TaxID=1658060 RepID=A0ABX0TNA8_9SPHN|nr:hypothetical protein [Sphingomonas vulcanisoli]NIJ07012.1 hypothetical protein [Sphingomonas vulcanisoli]